MSIVYVSFNAADNCQHCGCYSDLRMGVCFQCADYIVGRKTESGAMELWHKKNPEKKWRYQSLRMTAPLHDVTCEQCHGA